MQVFVRGLDSKTVACECSCSASVADLKALLQDLQGIPSICQSLTYSGRQLQDEQTLGHYGIAECSTITMLLRLVGGKGGFGALLRGLGRDGSKTVNQDACRDLQGRRLRYSNAEKKLQDWQDQAHEREMEKVALKHIKEQERAEKREARAKVEVDVIVKEQKDVVSRVAASVQEAMAGTSAPLQQAKRPAPDRAVPPAGSGPGTSGSGKAAGPAGPVKKKPKMLSGLESFGSDESDLSDSDEE